MYDEDVTPSGSVGEGCRESSDLGLGRVSRPTPYADAAAGHSIGTTDAFPMSGDATSRVIGGKIAAAAAAWPRDLVARAGRSTARRMR
jgi:hypothetical protein